ncbi:MAG: hypothetical protein GX825_04925, partial [Syntrophomonadaceae bacterium]|nr:hypothetical protein [Syntrophomonadaceae bacterium]
VMFNVLSILQQMYINQGHKKATLVAESSSIGAGEVIAENSSQEEVILEDVVVPAGEGKGGKTNAKHRKKGKKR